MDSKRTELFDKLSQNFGEAILGDTIRGEELVIYTTRDLTDDEVKSVNSEVQSVFPDIKYTFENLG